MAGERIILHMDMDAFYAAVEQRDDPALRGKPVIVGGPNRRGVVSTCSYEARPFGVKSAMPMAQAMQLCPQAIVVSGRLTHYSEVSREIMEEMACFTPLVEPLSLDEAFLDMTGSEALFGTPLEMAQKVKAAVFQRTQLSCSVGIARNKFLAKLASDIDKPDAITLVPFGDETRFLAPLPIRSLWGVGPRSAERLLAIGMRTIGDIAHADPGYLEAQLGSAQARHLHALANARDDRRVIGSRVRKSVGSETTLADDVRGRQQVKKILRAQCQRVARHLRSANLVARGIRVKLRYSRGFRLATRQASLPIACDDSATLIEHAFQLLERLDLDRPIRLVGAAAFDLERDDAAQQLDLFHQKRGDERSQLEHTVDEIRNRFGDKIGYGSS
jgi:DNA polymerase-4